MRPETPPRYSRGILERIGLSRPIPPPVLMIARNIGRRPAKALLSTFGIALAVGILVLTRYFGDVIDWMVQIQFRETQLEDVTVILGQPRSASVLHDLAHLPGVRAVEPFRAVSARLPSSRA
jgi:putative ABC transport system permease protein